MDHIFVLALAAAAEKRVFGRCLCRSCTQTSATALLFVRDFQRGWAELTMNPHIPHQIHQSLRPLQQLPHLPRCKRNSMHPQQRISRYTTQPPIHKTQTQIRLFLPLITQNPLHQMPQPFPLTRADKRQGQQEPTRRKAQSTQQLNVFSLRRKAHGVSVFDCRGSGEMAIRGEIAEDVLCDLDEDFGG